MKTLCTCLLIMMLFVGCNSSHNCYKERLDLINSEMRELIIQSDTTGLYLLRAERLEIYKHLTQ